MSRKEIYTKYAKSAGVKTLATILHYQDIVDEDTVFQAVKFLSQLTQNAMIEAGCEIHELGRFYFDDAIYFDFTMPLEDKIFHLNTCKSDQSDKIKELKELALCL